MTLAPVAYLPWLQEQDFEVRTDGKTGVRHYRHRGGPWLVSTTTALGIIAKGYNYDNWIAQQERDKYDLSIAEAVLEPTAPEYLLAAVKQKVGRRLVYTTIRDTAADGGTAVHAAVRAFLEAELGHGAPPVPALSAEGLVQFSTFCGWWRESGLKAVRMEQRVLDPVLGYAGQFDFLAEWPNGNRDLFDVKNAKYVSDNYHLQLASYAHAARRHDDIHSGWVVKTPKGGRPMEIVEMGNGMWCGERTEAQLMDGFRSALSLWRCLNREAA